MALYRCMSGGGTAVGTSQTARMDGDGGNWIHTYPSDIYGNRFFVACLSSHYQSGTKTTLTWTCDTGNITQIVNEEAVNSAKFEVVRYDGAGTLTLDRKTHSNDYYAIVGLVSSSKYSTVDVVASGSGTGSGTIDTSLYGNDFIILGVQLDYQCTSKITVSTSDSGVTIEPYMVNYYPGYSKGEVSAYHIKTNGSGIINFTRTANSNNRLGATRILVIH